MRKQKEPNWLAIVRIALALVFIFSSITKAINPVGFGVTMHDYFISFGMGFLQPIALVSGILATTAEFILGFMLLTRSKVKLAALGFLVFMTFFFFLTAWLALAEYLETTYPEKYYFGVVRDCGCFGDAVEMTNLSTFLKNVAIMVPTLLVFRFRNSIPDVRLTELGKWLFTSIAAAVIFVFQIYSVNNLPIRDLSEWSKGANAVEKFIEKPEIKEFVFVYKNNENDSIVKLNSTGLETITNDIPLFYDQYSYVDREETVITEAVEALIKGFSMLDTAGNDFAPVLINPEKENTFFVFMFDLVNVKKEGINNLKPLIAYCKANNIDIVGITNTPEAGITQFLQENPIGIPIYRNPIDATKGPFIVRDAVASNPGLILIDKGIVIEKWSWKNIPSKL